MHGIEETERVLVRFNKDQFEHETRDMARGNLIDFYKSEAFLRDYKLEDKFIVTNSRV